jgi:Flp pilus assembly CpaF family ATPase
MQDGGVKEESQTDFEDLQARYELEKIERMTKLNKELSSAFVITPEDYENIKKSLKKLLRNTVSESSIDKYISEKLGIGKLTPFLANDDLEEIMVIARENFVYVFDRKRGMFKTDVRIEEGEVKEIIKKIARYSGRVVNSENPLLDGRLPDGSRVNATFSSFQV